MRKLSRLLCLVLVLLTGLTMAGCGKNGQPSVAKNITDDLSSKDKKNYSFYVMKVQSDYKTIVDDCVDVYDLRKNLSTDLEDGQIAHVVADVSIVSGGIAGYLNDIFVKKVKKCEVLDYKDVTRKVKIPVAGSEEFSYNKRFFKYEEEDDIYFVFLDRQYIDVYKNGKRFMQYEFDGLEDYFSPFFEKIGK